MEVEVNGEGNQGVGTDAIDEVDGGNNNSTPAKRQRLDDEENIEIVSDDESLKVDEEGLSGGEEGLSRGEALCPRGSPLGDPGPLGDLFGYLGPLWVPFLCFGSPFSLF